MRRNRPAASAGISITPDNLKISDRAIICLPYHVQQDGLEEDRLATPSTVPPVGASRQYTATNI